ncbi:MAG: hypothetical protein IJT59_06870, partial [Desulfovibrionaceae bacterium]|nr:hypothetical protein [Desulfovibrionaceae bacterium]
MDFLEATLKNYERKLNLAGNRFLDDILAHQAEINEVAMALADEYSRQTYAEEIILHAFLNFMRPEAAAWFAGCMPVATWQEHMREAAKLPDCGTLTIPAQSGAEQI